MPNYPEPEIDAETKARRDKQFKVLLIVLVALTAIFALLMLVFMGTLSNFTIN